MAATFARTSAWTVSLFIIAPPYQVPAVAELLLVAQLIGGAKGSKEYAISNLCAQRGADTKRPLFLSSSRDRIFFTLLYRSATSQGPKIANCKMAKQHLSPFCAALARPRKLVAHSARWCSLR
jgi:hypothetical protein